MPHFPRFSDHIRASPVFVSRPSFSYSPSHRTRAFDACATQDDKHLQLGLECHSSRVHRVQALCECVRCLHIGWERSVGGGHASVHDQQAGSPCGTGEAAQHAARSPYNCWHIRSDAGRPWCLLQGHGHVLHADPCPHSKWAVIGIASHVLPPEEQQRQGVRRVWSQEAGAESACPARGQPGWCAARALSRPSWPAAAWALMQGHRPPSRPPPTQTHNLPWPSAVSAVALDLASQTSYLRDELKAARALIAELDGAASTCNSFKDEAQEVSEEAFRALSRLEQAVATQEGPDLIPVACEVKVAARRALYLVRRVAGLVCRAASGPRGVAAGWCGRRAAPARRAPAPCRGSQCA